MIRNRALSN